jgi:hypothetical protein
MVAELPRLCGVWQFGVVHGGGVQVAVRHGQVLQADGPIEQGLKWLAMVWWLKAAAAW